MLAWTFAGDSSLILRLLSGAIAPSSGVSAVTLVREPKRRMAPVCQASIVTPAPGGRRVVAATLLAGRVGAAPPGW